MISDKKAIECVETLQQFCKEQQGCQNCIFRLHGCDHWKCEIGIEYVDMVNVQGNYSAKKKNHGWI